MTPIGDGCRLEVVPALATEGRIDRGMNEPVQALIGSRRGDSVAAFTDSETCLDSLFGESEPVP